MRLDRRLILTGALALGLIPPAETLSAEAAATSGIVKREFLAENPPTPSSHASTIVETPEGLLAAWAWQRRDQRYGMPEFDALEGWIVGNLLAEGLRRAGKDLDSERLVAALEGIRDLDVGIGVRLAFSPTEHQASHKVWGTALQPDGSYRQIDLE